MENFEYKYLKYKNQYYSLKNQQQTGGNTQLLPVRDDGNGDPSVKKHLLLLEVLDFDGANKQNFDIVRNIYDKSALIRIANEPGSTDMKKNIIGMEQMYTAVPNIRVVKHSIQFGSGDWTAVELIMVGTFTGTYDMDGISCQPTGNTFEMRSCSLLRWKNNKIAEENIFWDNHHFLEQMGIPNNSCTITTVPTKYTLAEKVGFTSFGRGDETDPLVRRRLILFENFNYNGYNKRNWDLIPELYDKNVFLIFQSGSQLTGIDEITKQMTGGIKDDKVISIPIHFGSGDWTVATMLMTGTLESGTPWAMEHCALMKWQGDKIVEAHAYWDNGEFNKQTGIVLNL